jgi:hypothetical protein
VLSEPTSLQYCKDKHGMWMKILDKPITDEVLAHASSYVLWKLVLSIYKIDEAYLFKNNKVSYKM